MTNSTCRCGETIAAAIVKGLEQVRRQFASRARTEGVEELLTVAELAERWRCSRGHIYDLIAKKHLRSTDIGVGRAKTRIAESAAKEYLARNYCPVARPASPEDDDYARVSRMVATYEATGRAR